MSPQFETKSGEEQCLHQVAAEVKVFAGWLLVKCEWLGKHRAHMFQVFKKVRVKLYHIFL